MKIKNDNILIYSLIGFIIIVVIIILVKPNSKNKKDNLRTITPAAKQEVANKGEVVTSEFKSKSGWEVYNGASFKVVYPSGYITQVSDSYEFVKFSSEAQKIEYQLFVPDKPSALDKNFEMLPTEKIDSKKSGKAEKCTTKICATDIIVVTGADYKKKMVIRKDVNDLIVSAASIKYPVSQEANIQKDFNYFQEAFVIQKPNKN